MNMLAGPIPGTQGEEPLSSPPVGVGVRTVAHRGCLHEMHLGTVGTCRAADSQLLPQPGWKITQGGAWPLQAPLAS